MTYVIYDAPSKSGETLMALVAENMVQPFELPVRVETQQAQLPAERKRSVVTVESRRGEVRLAIDAAGGLTSLKFGASADRMSLDQLADLVMGISRQAQAKLSAVLTDRQPREI